ncbi:MAG: hypothetical protein U1E20_06220 [Methylocystis sp.]|uniref:hypothetical protein n=1 Tax=Methylocystis sp. TaxID=1911079 RepID=UPI00393506C9
MSGYLARLKALDAQTTEPSMANRDPSTSVARLFEEMAAEYARRRDWWKQPVEGWRAGRLTIRNIVRDETVVVDFQKWRAAP